MMNQALIEKFFLTRAPVGPLLLQLGAVAGKVVYIHAVQIVHT
jgi:hypothetical protein